MKKLTCTGLCKLSKLIICFRPYDQHSTSPICRECRKKYAKRYEIKGAGIPRADWTRQANSLCPGSTALERGDAA